MNTDHKISAATQQYAVAYATHHTDRDLLAAPRDHDTVIEFHSGARMAEYSRTQIRNIVSLVVPAGVLLAPLIELVCRHLQRDGD